MAELEFHLDHVALAVRDAGRAARFFLEVMGGKPGAGGENSLEGYRWRQYRFASGKIELLEPTGAGFLSRFLERRGEGVHHVTFLTPDLTLALEAIRASGVEPIRVNLDHPYWKEAFIHPRDAFGVLIQIAQASFREPEDRDRG